MGKQKLGQAQSDHEYIRAAQIELRELKQERGVHTDLSIVLSERLGVFSITLTAYLGYGTAGQYKLCSYTAEWPNAHAQTFTTCLFNACVRLTRLVEDSLRSLRGEL